jgi:hypothetical protein
MDWIGILSRVCLNHQSTKVHQNLLKLMKQLFSVSLFANRTGNAASANQRFDLTFSSLTVNAMKNQRHLFLVLLIAGLFTWGCTPENLQGDESSNGMPSLAGAEGDPHPALETICQSADTVFLMSEDGSDYINKCYGANGQVPCSNGSVKWGYVIMREGYYGGTGYIDCEFTMAPGWYGESTYWKVGNAASAFEFDSNGLPMVQADWSAIVTSPCENRWILRFPTSSLPSGSFDIMMLVHGVRLNIWGAPNTASETNLWAKNPHSNDPSNTMFSATSPLMLHFTPILCAEPVVEESICQTLKVGAPALPSCCSLTVNTSGLNGTLSYNWSTGSTASTISVCPTTTTTYSVTVSANDVPAIVNNITVNVQNIACGNTNPHGNGGGNGNNPDHKVTVCHLPPGNPSNQQDICIDWSGVPAHVAEYRPAGSQQGHDSGCQIGQCGSNPCL